jgi:formate hydrogenlyase subunit 3/multisubunit Na+/H+ antiporter MnhD subunit
VWIGTVTMAVGVMYAMVQSDLKRMLAFSTVSQIGYMMLGIGIGTPLAITAGLLHCLNHGFFKGGLFLTAGSVQHAAGTRDMNKLGGLAQRMPHTTLSWLIGVGSMVGIPLMSGFASKWMLYAAALQAGWTIPAVVAWAVSLGTVFLGAKATSAVFLGPVSDATKDAYESPATMLWGMGVLAAGSVVLGIAPQLAVDYFLNPVLGALGMGAGVHVTWLGLSTDAGSFSSMGGLVLAIVSLVLGGAIYALAYASHHAPATVAVSSGGAAFAGAGGGIFTGGEPLSEQDRLTASDFSSIFLQNWRGFFHWSNVDRVYLAVWNILKTVSRGVGVVISWMEQRATILLVFLAAAVFVLLRWAVPGSLSSVLGAAEPQSPTILIAGIVAAGVALLLAMLAFPARLGPAPWFCALLLPGLSTAGLASTNPWLRISLLEFAALLTVSRVWLTARTKSAKVTYLAAVLISAASTVAANLFEVHGDMNWARAFLLTGIVVKLAAVPMFFWLLALADELPALILGLIIAIVDMAAFGELYIFVHASPGMFSPQSLVLWAAVLTSLLAALLMLTQRSLKRLLVLSTVEDVGFLLFGLGVASSLGTNGALLAATSHSLAKALLFISLSAPEADGSLNSDAAGLAIRYPFSAFGFLIGMLAMLGIPPTIGFLGRWRIYESAVQIGWPLAAVLILSSVLALIAYVMALTRYWWGPANSGNTSPDTKPAEPFLLQTAIVALVVLIVAAGIWPGLLEVLRWGRL